MSTYETRAPAPGAAGFAIGGRQPQAPLMLAAPLPDDIVGVCECPCGCTCGGPGQLFVEVVHRPRHTIAGMTPQTYRLCPACVVVLGLRTAGAIPDGGGEDRARRRLDLSSESGAAQA